MATAFDRVDFIHRLEETGLARKQAEAISSGIMDGTRDLVTNERMEAALDRLLIRLGVLFGGGLTLAVAAIGILISLN